MKPSVEGMLHLRKQGWTFEGIGKEYGMSGAVYWMLRDLPVHREDNESGR
ncbi:hypothetical protein [Streptomyces glomeratus]|uniref:Transposase n=1 Tax=Streptomyces glomeratus TaxID=284452 RepID=A0ABN3YFB5_9ACTN|nr:hypothetical protein [Streptomyces glomeratus]MCF1509085.1 hypothetical protein [Streptomyces glomeratus]